MKCRVREQHSNPFHAGRNLLEHAEPLATHRGLEILKSGDVAARAGKARDKTAVDRLGYLREHNRDVAFQTVKQRKRRITYRDDYIRC